MPTFSRLTKTISILLSVCLIGGLFLFPEQVLPLFWSLVIPLLPITFMISPLIWRSVCPIAIVNKSGNRFSPQYTLPQSKLATASAASISLFFLLVPARRFVFNENPEFLAYTIIAVLLLAFVLGTQFKFKSGFCNAICPVLPVEKLYGQSPLLEVNNTRCDSCSLCTAKGCLDVSPEKGITKVVGKHIQSGTWQRTPLGIFALALPGFIVGYFVLVNTSLDYALGVYAFLFASSAASYVVSLLILLTIKISFTQAMPIWGSLSIGLYYWFAASDISAYLHLPDGAITLFRLLFLAIIGVWLVSRLGQRKSNYRVA